MKILEICNKSPYPPVEGGPIAMNSIIEGLLNEGHQVKVLAMDTFKHPVDFEKLPNDYVKQTNFESVFVDLSIKIIPAFLNLFTIQSYHVQRFISRDFSSKLGEILLADQYDIIQLETIFLGPYIPLIRKYSDAKIIIRSHNIEHLIWKRIRNQTKNLLKKLYLNHLYMTLKWYERKIINRADGIACISNRDAMFYLEFGCKKPLIDIPFGININSYQPIFRSYKNPLLIHIGSMNWIPNEEGFKWFLQYIWPSINEKYPELKFKIAGRYMPEWLMNSDMKGLDVIGEVDDAKQFIQSGDIMIVPLLSGSGIRIKIIEGMALGKTIISTTIGAEGIPCENQKNILIADTKKEFIDQIIFCIEKPEKCKEIGIQARKLIESTHNNIQSIKKLTYFYASLIEKN